MLSTRCGCARASCSQAGFPLKKRGAREARSSRFGRPHWGIRKSPESRPPEKKRSPREKLRCTEVEGRPASDALCLQYIIANTLSTTAARNEMVIFHGKRVCFEKTV